MLPSVLLAVTVLALSVILTGLARRFAQSRGILDVPNLRSSHQQATPRAGGAAIVVTMTLATVLLAAAGTISPHLCAALVGGGLLVAAVGLADDRRPLPPGVRFAAQTLAALWALGWLGGFSQLQVGAHVAHLGWAGRVLALLGILWSVNLFNFMDGIDGIAASEAVFVAAGGAILATLAPANPEIVALAWILAWACAGFLCWNWPPARIFMGDVGSGYLGYVIVILALAATRDNPVALWVWLILGGVFFVDATVTLLRRLLRGERVYEAHRSHAYQWLARRWKSHRKVTLAVLAVNLVWLLPCAAVAAAFPSYAAVLVVLALAPLAVLAVAIGSGRAETSPLGG